MNFLTMHIEDISAEITLLICARAYLFRTSELLQALVIEGY
jgi:hypothetical protein